MVGVGSQYIELASKTLTVNIVVCSIHSLGDFGLRQSSLATWSRHLPHVFALSCASSLGVLPLSAIFIVHQILQQMQGFRLGGYSKFWAGLVAPRLGCFKELQVKSKIHFTGQGR